MDYPDVWSNRFLRFKDSHENDVRGAAIVLHEATKELLPTLGLVPSNTALLVALSSKHEQLVSTSPLARIGKWIAGKHGLKWAGDSLTKAVHRPLHSLTGGGERDAEVQNKYVAQRLENVNSVVVLDDLVTRGATFGEVARAIHVTNPNCNVIGVALGKNEKRDWASQFGVNVNNEHVSKEWDELWDKAQKPK